MPFTDNFTGSSGDNLEGRTGWTLAAGALGAAEINSANQLKATGVGSTGHAYTAPSAGSADHYAQCVYLGGLSGPLAPGVRVTDAHNYFAIRAESGGYTLYRRTTAGGLVSIGSYATTPVSGDVLKLAVSGTSLEFFLNSVSRITVTDSAHSGVQTPGLICRSSTADPWLDDWESTQAGGGPVTYFQTVSGSITGAGALRKRTSKHPTGSLTPSGSLTTKSVLTHLLQGSMTPSGALRKITKKLTAGALTASGSLRKKTSRLLHGTISATGSVLKKVQRKITGSISLSGSLATQAVIRKTAAGIIALAGALSSFSFTPIIEAISSSLTHLRRFCGRR